MKNALLFLFFIIGNTLLFSQENLITTVQIEGNTKIKTSFIKKIITLETGTVLDSLTLEKDMIRLKRLPAVAHAYYKVQSLAENECTVRYYIEENVTIIPSANVYTSNDGEFAYRIGVYEFNLLGRGISIGGFFQRDIYNSFGISFRAPFLFHRKIGLAINYQNLTTLEPVFLEEGTSNYRYANNSIEVLGLYEINYNHRIELGINSFTEDYNYKNGAVNIDIPQNVSVDKTLYKLIYEYSDLNYHYQYVSGFKSVLNFQYVTTKNDLFPKFLIGFNDFLYYKRVGKKGNWANRMRIGFATNGDSPFAPFSVENNVNIRGVGNLIDRGTAAIVLNTEYRHLLFEKGSFLIQGNAFIDAGTWRLPGGSFSDFTDSDNIRISPGIGLRFIHKKIFNAIFRIDYGVGIVNEKAHGLVFGVGQYF